MKHVKMTEKEMINVCLYTSRQYAQETSAEYSMAHWAPTDIVQVFGYDGQYHGYAIETPTGYKEARALW